MKIQFIWCWKIWKSILKILLKKQKKENIFIETKTKITKASLKKEYKIQVWLNNTVNIVFLLVKPQHFNEINFSIFNKNIVYISFIAWISIKNISKKVISNNIIRVMPNTPILVWKGVIWYFINKDVENKYIDFFIKTFNKYSKLINCKTEDKINKITAISGSGPAYYYYFTEILKNKAVKYWFSKKESEDIVYNTFIWSAILLEKSFLRVERLRENVTSKWWTTEEAIKELEINNFKNNISNAIDKAYLKAKEISK